MDDTNYPIENPVNIEVFIFPNAKQQLEIFLQEWPTTTPESYVEFYLNGWLAHNSRKFEGTRIDVSVPLFEQKRLIKNKKANLKNFILQICMYDGLSFYGMSYKALTQEPIYAISDGSHPDENLRVLVCTKQDVIKEDLDDIAYVIKMFSTSRSLIN